MASTDAISSCEALLARLEASLASSAAPKEAASVLLELKVALLALPLPSSPSFDPAAADARALGVARSAFECATLLAARAEDLPAFERAMAQLQPYYRDFGSLLPPSERQSPLEGLGLMALLATNKLSEFHTELELLALERLDSDRFIAFPVRLEQELMEGSYGPILEQARDVPHPGYAFFMAMLLDTARDRILDCSARAYESVALADLTKLLQLRSDDEAARLVAARGWEVDGGEVRFPDESAGRRLDIPAMPVIQQSLGYATELERIV